MLKLNMSYITYRYVFIVLLLTLTGCSKEDGQFAEKQSLSVQSAAEIMQKEEPLAEKDSQIKETLTDDAQEEIAQPIIAEVDWTNYFDGVNGTAVIYDPS